MEASGRKEVAEAVLIAALSAAAVRLVEAIADRIQAKRKKCKGKRQ